MEPNLPESGKPIGRRTHEPSAADRAKVARMASMGIPQYQIAMVFDISEKTLRRKYRTELSQAAVTANLRVAETLYQMATSGENAAASIFWAKTRCGFRSNVAEPTSNASAAVAPPKPSLYATEAPPADSLHFVDSKGDRIA